MTNQTARKATDAPLSPEQIRAVIRAHEARKKHRRYIQTRTVVRFIFWTAIACAVLWTLGHFHLLDDYQATCEALGQTCQP